MAKIYWSLTHIDQINIIEFEWIGLRSCTLIKLPKVHTLFPLQSYGYLCLSSQRDPSNCHSYLLVSSHIQSKSESESESERKLEFQKYVTFPGETLTLQATSLSWTAQTLIYIYIYTHTHIYLHYSCYLLSFFLAPNFGYFILFEFVYL